MEDEKELYAGIGRAFLTLIKTTDITKIYKMPVLYSLYNKGNVLFEVTEAQVLTCVTEGFGKGMYEFSDWNCKPYDYEHLEETDFKDLIKRPEEKWSDV